MNEDLEHRDEIGFVASQRLAGCVLRISLTAWMLGVMVLSWLLFRGPVISSIVKRVGWARNIHDTTAAFFGGG